MSSNDVLAQVTPSRNGSLALLTGNLQARLVGLIVQVPALTVTVTDVEHHDRTEISHALLRHSQQPASIGAELDPLHGRGEVPDLDALARLDVPESDSVVRRAGRYEGAVGADVDGPERTLVAVVGAESLAVGREPDTEDLVLCDGEEKVAIAVELDLVEGPFLYERAGLSVFLVSRSAGGNRS